MLQKQSDENGVRLFYNKSSASRLLSVHLYKRRAALCLLVPHPFKIEAFLQNSLSLQCTYLCNS